MDSQTKEKLNGYYTRAAWSAIILLTLYFLVTRASRFLVLSPEAYGSYFWSRASWLFPHVICGTLALLIGPIQFSRSIRSRHLKLHRISGRIYLLSVLVAAASGFALAATSRVSLPYAWGLASLSFAWLLTTGMALFSILRKKVGQHREWMIRSYVVTFAFVTFRLGWDTLKHFELGTQVDQLTLMSWLSWAPPLLIAEAILQFRKVAH